VTYGSTNIYRPVNRSNASGNSGEKVIQAGGCPCPKPRATKLAMTVIVKTMDTQRWVCRTELFQFNGTSCHKERRLVRHDNDGPRRRIVTDVHGRLLSVIGFTIADDKVVETDILADPNRLSRLDLSAIQP
jgi:hypothetical protein